MTHHTDGTGYQLIWRYAAAAVCCLVLATTYLFALPHEPTQPVQAVVSASSEKMRAAQILGPADTANDCSSCHEPEAKVWRQTHHATGFASRHRSQRAGKILRKMGMRSMKLGADNLCRQCHYTSILKRGRVLPRWGVSCESCHSPAQHWFDVHHKPQGNSQANALTWGQGHKQTPAQNAKRLSTASQLGMVHGKMIYQLASRCLACHAVPEEKLVNVGDHKAGSAFDFLAWSSGEIRHRYLSALGDADTSALPTNKPLTASQKRVYYVVGILVDLQYSLGNLIQVKEKGARFHLAMVLRVNQLKTKALAILAQVDLPVLADAVDAIPAQINLQTILDQTLPDRMGQACLAFLEQHDGQKLAALDALLPQEVVGQPMP